MPEPAKLTKHQQGQLKQGRCACGCGKNRPREMREVWKTPDYCAECDPTQEREAPKGERGPGCSSPDCDGYAHGFYVKVPTEKHGGRWASTACRQRGYRQRKRAGTVIDKAARKRRADLARAAELESEAGREDYAAKAAASRRDDLNARAKAIRDRYEREDGGQLTLAASRAAK